MKPGTLTFFIPLIALSACCGSNTAKIAAKSSKLEMDHLAFIAKFTASPGPASPPPLPADFDSQVARISNDFDAAVSAASSCVQQKQILLKDKNLFVNEVALVREQHYISPVIAEGSAERIRQNYEQLSSASAQ
jgi:hypothetical protein